MNVLDSIKSIFGLNAKDKKIIQFEKVLLNSIEIVSNFGVVLENKSPEDGIGPLRSEKHLPYDKHTIEKAITFLKSVIGSDIGRTQIIKTLPPEEAQFVLSSNYSNALDSSSFLLTNFVPESMLTTQRQASLATSSFLNDIDLTDRKDLEEFRKFANSVKDKN